ncbi:MAG TPA: zinc dependent phospholipase C family protein [Syntrophales bacterium]|nr:zinc dependent phospholipase C family protein [Syntrophales bacterium]
MPKEITHWLLAEEVSGKLRGTLFEGPLQRNGNILRIGSIVHDAPYYYLKPDLEKRFGDLPKKLHGTVDDAYELIGGLLSYTLERPGQEKEPLLAFLVGFVTHLFADALMHPMIFYLTGRYDHPDFRQGTRARQDHRRLESLIDMHVAGGYDRVRGYSLASVLRSAETPLSGLYSHVGRAWLEPGRAEAFAEGLSAAFRLFAFQQGLIRNPFLGRLFYRLFPFSPSFVREILALSYSPQLLRYEGRITGKIPYRHPCTGQEHAREISSLFQEAVEQSVAFCRGLEPLLDPGADRSARLILPAVDPGLGFDPDHPMCHYSEKRFFE